jgi:hypothetical protein
LTVSFLNLFDFDVSSFGENKENAKKKNGTTFELESTIYVFGKSLGSSA